MEVGSLGSGYVNEDRFSGIGLVPVETLNSLLTLSPCEDTVRRLLSISQEAGTLQIPSLLIS